MLTLNVKPKYVFHTITADLFLKFIAPHLTVGAGKESNSGACNACRCNWSALSRWYTRQLPVFPMPRKLIKLCSSFNFVSHSRLRRSWAIMRNSTPRLCRCTDRSYPLQMSRHKLSWRPKLGLCRKPGSKVTVWLRRGRLSRKLSLRYAGILWMNNGLSVKVVLLLFKPGALIQN